MSEQLTSLTLQAYLLIENKMFIQHLIVDTVLGPEDIQMNKLGKKFCSYEVSFKCRERGGDKAFPERWYLGIKRWGGVSDLKEE